MGNYRFRLSDMMPNAWFYKLKDMGRTRNHSTSHHPIKKKHLSSTSTPTPTTNTTLQPKKPYISQPRHSYYFTTEDRNNPKPSHTLLPDPPRKSSKRRSRSKSRSRRRTTSSSALVTSSVSAGCSCRATVDSVWTTTTATTKSVDSTPDDISPDSDLHGSLVPEFGSHPVSATDRFDGLASWSSSCSCRLSSSTTDIIIDMDANNSSSMKFDKLDSLDLIPELELPPILTKPAPKFSDMISNIKKKETEPTKFRRRTAKLEERNGGGSVSAKLVKEESIKEEKPSPHIRRSSSGFQGLKLRANSPRIASKKIQQVHSRKSVSSTLSSRSSQRKNISESFAVVKSSFDPQRDFRDSMVEMIVENNIRTSKDLEELLACYLSLNSNEYHDLIVKVFEKIWFDLTDIQL